jgi:hypothetical protein
MEMLIQGNLLLEKSNIVGFEASAVVSDLSLTMASWTGLSMWISTW